VKKRAVLTPDHCKILWQYVFSTICLCS